MNTLIYHHADCARHLVPPSHPERPARLRVIDDMLTRHAFYPGQKREAPFGDRDLAKLVHPAHYVDGIAELVPAEGLVAIDGDTYVSPGSWDAAMRGLGAVSAAVDQLVAGEADNIFCAIRPPGHHAETRRAMGFCLFNTIAIGAFYARKMGMQRVAVVDFDVHHGNGTQEIFWSDRDMFYGSTHQMPLFPGTGRRDEEGVGNIVNAPLRAGDDGEVFKAAMTERILPALRCFSPELIFVSAGFDAHWRDPLANLQLTEDDFFWATAQLMDVASRYCHGRLISVLEGGYDLEGLSRSVAAHVSALSGKTHTAWKAAEQTTAAGSRPA